MPNLKERHAKILERIDLNDFVSVQDLSETLNVSLVTIRKDLNYLELEGLVYRTHGGASKRQTYAYERSVREKEEINIEEKRNIAKEAVKFIEDNDSVILGSGTTTHYLAKAIDGFEKLTILTPSLPVALELCGTKNVDIIQLGGEIRKNSASSSGTITEYILSKFSCNKLFLGIDGIDIDFGISTSNASVANLNHLMIQHSDRVYILADSSKIGKKGLGKIAELNAIDTLITDSMIPAEYKTKLEEMGIEVVTI